MTAPAGGGAANQGGMDQRHLLFEIQGDKNAFWGLSGRNRDVMTKYAECAILSSTMCGVVARNFEDDDIW